MNKMNKIQNIKRIINTFGNFSTVNLEAESSPIINTMGKDNVQLAEHFYDNGIVAITYIQGIEVNNDFIKYENLNNNIIDEINDLAENYELKPIETNN